MRAITSLTLVSLLLVSACSSSPTKHRKLTPKHKFSEKLKIRQPVTAKKTTRKKTKKPILSTLEPYQKILLPTQIHRIDGTLMILVNPPVNQTRQQNAVQETMTDSKNLLNASSVTKAFYIDHTEVTVEQYKKTHPKYDQIYITTKDGCPSCPAMGIDWNNANEHCRLVGKRLPTEEEWESAARGPSKTLFPWNNKTDRLHANLVGDKDGFISVAPVGSFPSGAGPYGAMDMIGNVWEWVSTPHSPLPTNLKQKKNKTPRIVKGGGWASQHHLATISYRKVVDGKIKNATFGFRCAKSVG